MTVTYGFFDGLNGDRKYNALQFGKLFEGIITDGIFQNVGNGFLVSANTGMYITAGPGRAWFNNRWINNDANISLMLESSELVLPRIDSVVIEVNEALAVRTCSIKIIKGTPASTPAPPTLAATSTLHQYRLADIYVAPNITEVGPEDITNKVGVIGGTPIITGIIQSLDWATLNEQLRTSFLNWFNDLQDELTSNQATNLQAQINALNLGWDEIPTPTYDDEWHYSSANIVNVPAGALNKYSKGMKVRFIQPDSIPNYKYFYITSLTDTQLTIKGGTDYVLTNDLIANVAVSRAQSPHGFPAYFNFNARVTFGGSMSGTASALLQQFRIDGEDLFANIVVLVSISANPHTDIYIDLPMNVANNQLVLPQLALSFTDITRVNIAYVNSTDNPHKLTILKEDLTAWGVGANKYIRVMVRMRIA